MLPSTNREYWVIFVPCDGPHVVASRLIFQTGGIPHRCECHHLSILTLTENIQNFSYLNGTSIFHESANERKIRRYGNINETLEVFIHIVDEPFLINETDRGGYTRRDLNVESQSFFCDSKRFNRRFGIFRVRGNHDVMDRGENGRK